MKQYETGFLISPNLSDEEREKLVLQMAQIVSEKKGKMLKEDNWGKRKLAYPIKKFDEAFYVFFLYKGEPDVCSELERRFKQTDAVLRYLTVRKEQRENVKEKKTGVKAEEETEVESEKEEIQEEVLEKEEPPSEEEKGKEI